MGLTFETWKSKVLGEYMRLSGDGRHDAVMFMDHCHGLGLLRDMYDEETEPERAAQELMFEDLQIDD